MKWIRGGGGFGASGRNILQFYAVAEGDQFEVVHCVLHMGYAGVDGVCYFGDASVSFAGQNVEAQAEQQGDANLWHAGQVRLTCLAVGEAGELEIRWTVGCVDVAEFFCAATYCG